MLLFCLAHAGGSTIAYEKLKSYLFDDVLFVPLELPGHLRRAKEPLCTDFNRIIDDLTATICSYIDEMREEYILFGHSLGAVLAYFLFFSLEKQGKRLPVHLIFSGRWPPFVIKKTDEGMEMDVFIDDEICRDS